MENKGDSNKTLKKKYTTSPGKKREYNTTHRLKEKRTEMLKNDDNIENDSKDDSDEETSVEHELMYFLYGHPMSFFNLIPGVPIKNTPFVNKRLFSNEYTIGGMPWLHYYQAKHRVIDSILVSRGFKYSDLPKLQGTSRSWRTVNTSAWKSYVAAYDELMFKSFEIEEAIPFEKAIPFEESIDYEPSIEQLSSPLYFDRIVENHQAFVKFLYNTHGINYDEWIECIVSAFVSDGLYIPFNSPDEIIHCVRKVIL